ncbi:MAG: thioredoxin family protein [Gemmatimonadetes bacterium]|nr:thioredoxin family protein [Gemmatimonadota bacterium]
MTGLLGALTTAALLCGNEPARTADAVLTAVDSNYAQLYADGRSFADFLARAERRKEQWERNFQQAVVPDALLARARAARGPWKFLVVAVDGCSDSVNTIPYLAKLVEQLMGAELRIIGSDVGRGIMDSHKTPDGRGATPTVLLLDANHAERGCWVERPAALITWLAKEKSQRSENELFEGKMGWYDNDKGMKTLEDLVAMLEKASRGEKGC